MEVRVGPAVIMSYVDDEILVCEPNGELSSGAQHGYFIADTRLVSGYRLRIGRNRPLLLNSAQVAAHSSRFEFTNAAFLDDEGAEVPEHCLHLRLDRSLGRGVHEDYELTNYASRAIDLIVEVSLESDFADLFDVKDRRLQRRGVVESSWNAEATTLVNSFRHEGFTRGIRIEAREAIERPTYANGGLLFPVKLEHSATWRTCLLWRPILDEGVVLPTDECCHRMLHERPEAGSELRPGGATSFATSDPGITATIRQAVEDLTDLRLRAHVEPGFLDLGQAGEQSSWKGHEGDYWLPAAGVPWFVTLFGRDALTVSLQALPASYRFAEGSLQALGVLQATGTDDDRDMQPGKIEHELRRGELAALRLIPHTPYYGSHDATPLYVLCAAATWSWHGSRAELDVLRPHVEAALGWIARDGDLDGDGLLEYQTRSTRGYFNQGWKDAHDAIQHADGSLPELPIATCELQGLVVAAKRAWADVLEEAFRESTAAQRLRDEADRLQAEIERRFFWEDEGTYYLGLDGHKRPIETVASNAGHLLAYGAIDPERAKLVAGRLFAADLWSGWGIRTLAASHPAFNPFSYQCGSIWPHDNVLIAAGLRRYGLDAEAHAIARAMFDAADCFVSRRLPELFAGLARDEASFPVQYLGANVPQAWASGAIIQLIDVLVGFEPHADSGELRLHPALPRWLEEVSVADLLVGEDRVGFTVRRDASARHKLEIDSPARIDITLGDSGTSP
jgi:glycogen debranching enzyme